MTKCNWCGAEWGDDLPKDICLQCGQLDYIETVKEEVE